MNLNSRNPVPVGVNEVARQNLLLWLWLYFWLLIFEGALRKWVLPGFSDYLLIIRDPIVLLIYFQAHRHGFLGQTSRYLLWGFTTFGLLLLALLQTKNGIHPIVSVYGVRTYVLHVPLIFIMPQVVRYSDIIKFGKWMMIVSIPMAALMCAQYLAPSATWLNAATIEDGSQITAAGDKIRPAGTFSFTTGVSCFYRTALAFALYGVIAGGKRFSKILLIGVFLSTAAAAMVSGSRTFIMACLLVLLFSLPLLRYHPRLISRYIGFAVLAGLAFIVMLQIPTTRAGLETLVERWTGAAEVETDVYVTGHWTGRVFAGPIEAFYWMDEVPLTGYGLGLGTNVGGKIMAGSASMIAPEWEWPRMIFEVGPFVGAYLILVRIFAALVIMNLGLKGLKIGQFLGWLLLGTVVYDIIQGQLKQPTNLGFVVFFTGLAWAAMKVTIKISPLSENRRMWEASNAKAKAAARMA